MELDGLGAAVNKTRLTTLIGSSIVVSNNFENSKEVA